LSWVCHNSVDKGGDTALHLAVQKCNPKKVAALLLHPDIDGKVLNNGATNATWKLRNVTDHSKTLNWVRTLRRILVFLIISTYSTTLITPQKISAYANLPYLKHQI